MGTLNKLCQETHLCQDTQRNKVFLCQETQKNQIFLCHRDGSFDTKKSNFCVKRTVPLTQNGFSYLELIVGMGILLLTMSFFLVMFRFSITSRILAQEKTAMATAAQNAAEVYKSSLTDPALAVETEMRNEGFTDFTAATHINTVYDSTAGLNAVTITIPPRSEKVDTGDFVIKFYVIDNSIYR